MGNFGNLEKPGVTMGCGETVYCAPAAPEE